MLALVSLSLPSFATGVYDASPAPVRLPHQRVVLAHDAEEGAIEAHFQLEVSGATGPVAWVIPVPGDAQLVVSSEHLFDELSWRTNPRFSVSADQEGRCLRSLVPPLRYEQVELFSSNQPRVPYVKGVFTAERSLAILQPSTAQELVGWLLDEGVQPPSQLVSRIEPYLTSGHAFVVVAVDASEGDLALAPLGVRWAGGQLELPLVLSAGTAELERQLDVSLLAQERRVPVDWPHLALNEAALSWLGAESNYFEIVGRAVHEAGGQGFVTQYAGPLGFAEPDFVVAAPLREAGSPTAWLQQIQEQQVEGGRDLWLLYARLLPVRQGLDERSVWDCPTCFDDWYAGPPFDAAYTTDELYAAVVEPRLRTWEVIGMGSTLTRLVAVLDPTQITHDTAFASAPDLGEVEREHVATLVYECGGQLTSLASRRLELPGGDVIAIPSELTLSQQGITAADYLAGLQTVAASRIEQLGADGQLEVVDDRSGAIDDEIDAYARQGCGCTSRSGLPGGLLALMGFVGLRRRSRS